jgi:hypothetical protein
MAGLAMIGRDSLGGQALPVIVWSLHFLWCYVVNAVLCAKGLGADAALFGLSMIQWNVVIATAVALTALGVLLATSIARLSDRSAGERDAETSESSLAAQRLFLARALAALTLLATVATLWVAMPILFISSCR